MDYSGFPGFPFPSILDAGEERVRDYFFSLPDEEQLELLDGCLSYHSFFLRVARKMRLADFSEIPPGRV